MKNFEKELTSIAFLKHAKTRLKRLICICYEINCSSSVIHQKTFKLGGNIHVNHNTLDKTVHKSAANNSVIVLKLY